MLRRERGVDIAILRLENIQKSFGKTEVIRGLSLEIERGEFVTLLGPSGCGKTTTLRIIAGLEGVDGGSVRLNGEDVTHAEPNKRSVNTVFQNYALFPHMNVAGNIGYGPRIRGTSKQEIRARVARILELVKMEGFERRMPHQLSGGQRQRVAVARALINGPDVILLDEPLGALDLTLRRHMQSELKQLQKKTGVTFVYVTHDQEEALNMSDRIAVMNAGRVEQYGPPNEIYGRPATTFVARFVGERNIIIRGGGKSSAILTDRTLLLNELPEPGGIYAPALRGTVIDVSRAGPQTRVNVAAEGGRNLTAVEYNSEREFAEGEGVFITWKKDDEIVITA